MMSASANPGSNARAANTVRMELSSAPTPAITTTAAIVRFGGDFVQGELEEKSKGKNVPTMEEGSKLR